MGAKTAPNVVGAQYMRHNNMDVDGLSFSSCSGRRRE